MALKGHCLRIICDGTLAVTLARLQSIRFVRFLEKSQNERKKLGKVNQNKDLSSNVVTHTSSRVDVSAPLWQREKLGMCEEIPYTRRSQPKVITSVECSLPAMFLCTKHLKNERRARGFRRYPLV